MKYKIMELVCLKEGNQVRLLRYNNHCKQYMVRINGILKWIREEEIK